MRRLGTCCNTCGDAVTSTGTCACLSGDYRFLPPLVSFSDVKFYSGMGDVNINSGFPAPPSDCSATSWTLATGAPAKEYRSVGSAQLTRWDPTGVPTTGGVVGIDYPQFVPTGESHSECWYVSDTSISTGDSPEFYIPASAQSTLSTTAGECLSQVTVGGSGVGFWGRDIQKIWWSAATNTGYVVFKYCIYPEFLNIFRDQMTNPPPPTGSLFESVLIATHEFEYPSETPWIDQGFAPAGSLDASFQPDYECGTNQPNWIGYDMNVVWNPIPDGINTVTVADSTVSMGKDIPCGCWFNDEGGGCNPFTDACNDNPVSNLVLTRDGGTTVTQNADSYWENQTTIRIPVDTDMAFNKFYIDMRPAGQTIFEDTGNQQTYGAGNFIEFWDNGFTDGDRYELDSCEGNIRGENVQNPNTFITFDENNWSDCRS